MTPYTASHMGSTNRIAEDGLPLHPDLIARILGNEAVAYCLEVDPDAACDLHFQIGSNREYTVVQGTGNITGKGIAKKGILGRMREVIYDIVDEGGFSKELGFDQDAKIHLEIRNQSSQLNHYKHCKKAGDSRPLEADGVKELLDKSECYGFMPLSAVVVDEIKKQFAAEYDALRGRATQNGKVQVVVASNNGELYVSKVIMPLQVTPHVLKKEKDKQQIREYVIMEIVNPVVEELTGKTCNNVFVTPFQGCIDVDAGDASTKLGDGGLRRCRGGHPYGKDGCKVEVGGGLFAGEVVRDILKNTSLERCAVECEGVIGEELFDSITIDTYGADLDGGEVSEINRIVKVYGNQTLAEIIKRYDLKNPDVIREIGRNGISSINPKVAIEPKRLVYV